MKATIDTRKLRDAVGKVALAVAKRSMLPITQNILADFTEGKVKLTGTNLECAVSIEIEAEVEETFSAILHPRTLASFLKGKEADTTSIHLVPGREKGVERVVLERPHLGKLDFRTQGQPKDFPPEQKIEKPRWSAIDAKFFGQMVNLTLPAMATEESRPVLTGLSVKEGEVAAADGFRLNTVRNPRLTFGLGDVQTIIPGRTLDIMRKLFDKRDSIEFAFNTRDVQSVMGVAAPPSPLKEVHQLFARSGNISIVSQVCLGVYPKYETLIPHGYTSRATFSAPLMAQRIGMIDEKLLGSGIVRLTFYRPPESPEYDGVCKIQALVADDEMAYEMDMPVKFDVSNPELSHIAFNIKYIREVLKYFSTCTIELTNTSSPGVFTGDLEGVKVLIMPMFVQW